MDPRHGRERGHTGERLPLDALAALLGNSRRRFVLRYLQLRDAEVPIEELSEALARWECDDLDEVTPHLNECIRASLHHVHLPKLVDAGLVRYDPAGGRAWTPDSADFGRLDSFLPRDLRVPSDLD